MATFYHCYPSKTSKENNQLISKVSPVQDIPTAVKIIQKASLSVNDVGIKLQLSEVTRFIQKYAQSLDTIAQRRNPAQKEKTSILSKMSQSVLSQEIDGSYIRTRSQEAPNMKTSAMGLQVIEEKPSEAPNLTWRCAVTQNHLEENDSVKEALGTERQIQQLEEQNLSLRNWICQIKAAFQGNQPEEPNNLSDMKTIIQEICQRAKQSFHQRSSKPKTENESHESELNELSKEVATKNKEIQQYELLLFVKEEQLQALKVILAEKERKKQKVTVDPEKKKLRKCFQDIENNFSLTYT